MPLVIGVTGGIGCGKTTATDRFATLGASIVDTDEISRALTREDHVVLQDIAQAFGPSVFQADGSLDRSRLRERVFAQPEARKTLEAILHPRIRQEVAAQVTLARGPYVLLVVPLLLETNAYASLVNRTLVIDCSPADQVKRVMQRSGLTRNEVERIIEAQVPRERRLARADDILQNSANLDNLYCQIDQLHQTYCQMAQQMAQ